MTHLLIDGDQFVFKACAAVEEEVRWDDQNHVLYSNFEKAWTNLQGMIGRIYDRFGTIDSTVCFSSYPTFRHAIDETYKAGRSRKPLCYSAMLERVWEEYECKAFPGLEADDVMGILATKRLAQIARKQSIIISQDKDMKTIPATIWDGKDLVTYTEAEADYWHLYQTLTGDATDGYKGCPGMGPKKAASLLDKALSTADGTALKPCVGVWWPVVAKAYEKQGLTEAHAITQARLARILRWSDWDANKKEPRLWCP